MTFLFTNSEKFSLKNHLIIVLEVIQAQKIRCNVHIVEIISKWERVRNYIFKKNTNFFIFFNWSPEKRSHIFSLGHV